MLVARCGWLTGRDFPDNFSEERLSVPWSEGAAIRLVPTGASPVGVLKLAIPSLWGRL